MKKDDAKEGHDVEGHHVQGLMKKDDGMKEDGMKKDDVGMKKDDGMKKNEAPRCSRGLAPSGRARFVRLSCRPQRSSIFVSCGRRNGRHARLCVRPRARFRARSPPAFRAPTGRRLGRRFRFANFLSALAASRASFALARSAACASRSARRCDLRIVETRLAAKLVQDVLPGLLRRLLTVCEARFLESTH